MALSLNIGKSTNLGNYRENNEDSIEVKLFPDLVVAVVADGMGGQAAGEIASKKAVDIIPRELRKNLMGAVNADATKVMIRRAIVQANEEIMAMGQLDREMKNMGTTVVSAVWRKVRNFSFRASATAGLISSAARRSVNSRSTIRWRRRWSRRRRFPPPRPRNTSSEMFCGNTSAARKSATGPKCRSWNCRRKIVTCSAPMACTAW